MDVCGASKNKFASFQGDKIMVMKIGLAHFAHDNMV